MREHFPNITPTKTFWPFRFMEVGDFFKAPCEKENSVRVLATTRGASLGRTYTVSKGDGFYIVTRTT